MNVSAPFALTGSTPLTFQVNGAPGAKVEILSQGDGCSIHKTIVLDATGKETVFIPRNVNCPLVNVLILARDDMGNETVASSLRI